MRYGLMIVFLLTGLSGFSQEIRISRGEIRQSSVDEYLRRAEGSTDRDSIYYYFNRALLIAQEMDYAQGQIQACRGLYTLYEKDEEIYEKLRYSLLLVSLYSKYGTEDQQAESLNTLGKLYFNEHLYAKASETLLKSAEQEIKSPSIYFESYIWLVRSQKLAGNPDDALVSARQLEMKGDKLSTHQKVQLYNEKAEIYHSMRAYQEELESYAAIDQCIRGTKYAYLGPANWNNIGYVHKFLGNFPRAKSAFYTTIRKPGTDSELYGAAYYNLGVIYQNDNYADSALYCFAKARDYYSRAGNTRQMASCYNMEAMVYYQEDDSFNAQKSALQAQQVAKAKNHQKVLARSYEIQSFIHQDLFEFELALEDYKKFLSIRDSLLTEERSLENKLLFDQYKVEQIEKQLRLIWARNEIDVINLAKEKAEKEAERERFNAREKEDQLRISDLQNKELKAMQELQRLMLLEEKLNVENQQKELALIQRDNDLKELALEKERLVVSENQKAISLLAQKNELERQKRLNEEEGFKNTMRLILSALFFIFLILVGILIAYRQLRKRKKHIEQQSIIIAESKREIEKEKEKSESLLLNILPHTVADELKANGSAKPKLYDEVSVGFTDFSGFTMISEKLSPEELVHKLDEIFYEFDLIIERYGLQQIKTIGDAYMFASGLPEEIPDHANRIVQAALDIRDFVAEHNRKLTPGEASWNIRIGVNTGPVVAGVIGIKKFAYDIWGDTVNTASRMESSGEIGRVNISGSTYDLIKGNFRTEYRGKIAAKNKGEIDMYFVERSA